jgi:hypothetical protein
VPRLVFAVMYVQRRPLPGYVAGAASDHRLGGQAGVIASKALMNMHYAGGKLVVTGA